MPVKVLIVDDSATSRVLLRKLFANDARFQIVGEAGNGRVALNQVTTLKPDIVLMDVIMPIMDGITAASEMMITTPCPIVLVSDLVGRDASLNFKALQAGALELLRKPGVSELENEAARNRFLRTIRSLSEVPVITRHRPAAARPATPVSGSPGGNPGGSLHPAPPVKPQAEFRRGVQLVAIGASTGGPPAILQILASLGKPLWPVVIVQHMTTGFIGGMANWLATATGLPVTLAQHREMPLPGHVYLAPDGAHLELREGCFSLAERPPERGNRPSINVWFRSVAQCSLAGNTLAVLLTGMGDDGAEGLRQLHENGAWTICQDEASSVVYGMPKVAAEIGAACEILPLAQIGPRLLMLDQRSQLQQA
jgi:two-component system chemotaxis response regulator CheB